MIRHYFTIYNFIVIKNDITTKHQYVLVRIQKRYVIRDIWNITMLPFHLLPVYMVETVEK